MSTLFLDTSYNQIVGLLNDQGAWLARSELAGQKSSAILHGKIHQICEECALSPTALKHVLYVAGPGFYTGLRIAYGVADVMRFAGKKISNFYNYEVPRLLGEQNYTWVTKAYRGEVFVHQCVKNESASQLLSEKDFLQRDWQGKLYIHHAQALDSLMMEKLPGAIETQGLMVQEMPSLFKQLSQTVSDKELHYFRPAEEEFKPSL